jgi:hypothetical protein
MPIRRPHRNLFALKTGNGDAEWMAYAAAEAARSTTAQAC